MATMEHYLRSRHRLFCCRIQILPQTLSEQYSDFKNRIQQAGLPSWQRDQLDQTYHTHQFIFRFATVVNRVRRSVAVVHSRRPLCCHNSNRGGPASFRNTSSVAAGFGRHGKKDRLTLKLVCESHLRWGTFLPNLGTLGVWVLDLFAM